MHKAKSRSYEPSNSHRKGVRHSSRFLLKNKKSDCVLDDTTVMEAN